MSISQRGSAVCWEAERRELFYETTADAIYVSRFDKDWLLYSQHRAGRTITLRDHSSAQVFFNFNYTQDVKSRALGGHD